MSKSRSFKKISNLALAIVMTIAMAIPSLGTVLVANASNNVIGWKELGVTQDTTFTTSEQNQKIGSGTTGTTMEFKGAMRFGSGGRVRFGFGGSDIEKAFQIQVRADGWTYLRWNNVPVRYINVNANSGPMLEQSMQDVDLIINVLIESQAIDATKSKADMTVTLTDAATNTELYTEKFASREIDTANLAADAWVFTDGTAKLEAKPSIVIPEPQTPDTNAGTTETPDANAGNAGTTETPDANAGNAGTTETPDANAGTTETPDASADNNDTSSDDSTISGANKLGDIDLEGDDKAMSPAVIAAIVIGAVVVIAAVVITVYVIQKKKGNKAEEQEGGAENE